MLLSDNKCECTQFISMQNISVIQEIIIIHCKVNNTNLKSKDKKLKQKLFYVLFYDLLTEHMKIVCATRKIFFSELCLQYEQLVAKYYLFMVDHEYILYQWIN